MFIINVQFFCTCRAIIAIDNRYKLILVNCITTCIRVYKRKISKAYAVIKPGNHQGVNYQGTSNRLSQQD